MLHEVKQPDCVEVLRRILKLQFRVLLLACNHHLTLPLTAELCQKHLGADGEWVWDRYRRQAGKFRTAFDALHNHIERDRRSCKPLLRAFVHDTRFHLHITDPHFYFRYGHLDSATQEAARLLMELFYGMNFSVGVRGNGQVERFNNDTFRNRFWEANTTMYLCPACDGQRPDVIAGSVQSENDHFFPISKYPFLSIHYMNLIPVCQTCNERAKRAQDPVDDHQTAPLIHTFHPYLRPARKSLKPRIVRKSGGELKLRLRDEDDKLSRRVKNLDTLLMLEERWNGRLKQREAYLIEVIRNQIRKQRGLKDLSAGKLIKEIELMSFGYDYGIGRFDGHYLDSNYKDFILSDQSERELLWKKIGEPLINRPDRSVSPSRIARARTWPTTFIPNHQSY
jgi:5-methylcytosine-specific restriction endonuclease McrA